jgi:hypothetical protein
MEYIQYMSIFGNRRMQIRQKLLNQSKIKILMNIICHRFAGESHKVVKITVT